MTFFSIAFSLFILMDSIGNIPIYISFLKKVPSKRQPFVICREMLIALVTIITFNFIGDGLMKFLQVQNHTIQIAGGIILFLICLKMIFPVAKDANTELSLDEEPFIVPLAIPLVAGPAVLAAVMIYARQVESNYLMVGAILLAWIASLVILLLSANLRKILGNRGIMAMERLMGLILILISVQMFLSGLSGFIQYNHTL